MIFHSLELSDLLWLLVSLLVFLLPFILGGLAIYVLRKKKNARDV